MVPHKTRACVSLSSARLLTVTNIKMPMRYFKLFTLNLICKLENNDIGQAVLLQGIETICVMCLGCQIQAKHQKMLIFHVLCRILLPKFSCLLCPGPRINLFHPQSNIRPAECSCLEDHIWLQTFSLTGAPPPRTFVVEGDFRTFPEAPFPSAPL